MLNALAFSTLLSSQGTDAHHQQPPGRLQGNYSNLPDAFPPVKSEPLMDSGEQVGDPPDLRNLTRLRMVPVHVIQNRIVPGVPVEPICRKALIPIRAAVQAPFPAPWCGSPTLHASGPGSDAVGHVEGCNFTVRTDIPDPERRTARNRITSGRQPGVRPAGRRRHRPCACPGARSGTGRAGGRPGTGRHPRR